MQQLYSPREQRKQYSLAGASMLVMMTLSLILPNLSAVIASVIHPGYGSSTFFIFAVNYGLMYLLGYPYVCLLLRLRTVGVPPKAKLKTGDFFSLIPICITLMYAGNLMGITLNALIGALRGELPENALQGILQDTDTGTMLLFVVILGPLLEELLFRKAIVDLLYPFGEKSCILVSALIFGLIHGNFYQFFYAALLGGLFSLVYCRTGKIRYTVFLHMLVNFLGSVVSSKILSLADMTAIEQGDVAVLLSENLLGTILYVGYSLLMMGMMVLGIVLLAIKLPKLRLKQSALPLHRPVLTALVNPGMLLFLAVSLMMIVIQF